MQFYLLHVMTSVGLPAYLGLELLQNGRRSIEPWEEEREREKEREAFLREQWNCTQAIMDFSSIESLLAKKLTTWSVISTTHLFFNYFTFYFMLTKQDRKTWVCFPPLFYSSFTLRCTGKNESSLRHRCSHSKLMLKNFPHTHFPLISGWLDNRPVFLAFSLLFMVPAPSGNYPFIGSTQ